MAQIGLHRVDLADAAERLQMTGKIGPPHRYPDKVVALGQRAHHMAAEEARAAIDGDEGFSVASGGHGRSREQKGAAMRAIQDRPRAVQARNGLRRPAMRFN